MKKIFSPHIVVKKCFFCLLALILSITCSHAALAAEKEMASWWGTYYNKENNTTLLITNVAVKYHLNENGVGIFSADFLDENENELCAAMGVFEEIDAHRVPVMYYGFAMSDDEESITVDAYDKEFVEQDGCTKAYFGNYIRQ